VKEAVRGALGERTQVRYTIPGDLFRRFREANGEEGTCAPSKPARPHRDASATLGLNRGQTLETFVEGRSNRVAYRAAREVARQPGSFYNPLFVYGDTGQGKTHLLMGIAQAMLAKDPKLKIHYGSGEHFANAFVGSLRSGDIRRFREKFRSLDVLIVDDVHLLVSKRHTQEEFLHTFNALGDGGSQIVLASDAHPNAIQQLAKGLVGRFVSGLVVRIDPVDFETRLKILRAASQRASIPLGEDVLRAVAQAFDTNVRDLMGAFTRLLAVASLERRPIGREQALEVLADLLRNPRRSVGPREILREVAAFYRSPVEEIEGPGKARRVARARQVAMYLLRVSTDRSLAEIGRLLGGRSHGTVAAAIRKVESLTTAGDPIVDDLAELRRTIGIGG